MLFLETNVFYAESRLSKMDESYLVIMFMTIKEHVATNPFRCLPRYVWNVMQLHYGETNGMKCLQTLLRASMAGNPILRKKNLLFTKCRKIK